MPLLTNSSSLESPHNTSCLHLFLENEHPILSLLDSICSDSTPYSVKRHVPFATLFSSSTASKGRPIIRWPWNRLFLEQNPRVSKEIIFDIGRETLPAGFEKFLVHSGKIALAPTILCMHFGTLDNSRTICWPREPCPCHRHMSYTPRDGVCCPCTCSNGAGWVRSNGDRTSFPRVSCPIGDA